MRRQGDERGRGDPLLIGRSGAILAVLLGASAACGPAAGSASETELTLFAAASLRDVSGDLIRGYTAGHPGISISASFDASSALRAQIEQGAAVDVFLSADVKNPQQLADRGGAHGGVVPFAGNLLTIIVPADAADAIGRPRELARPGLRIVAAGKDVPITAYADQVVERLAQMPEAPPDFVTKVAANVVSREDNVRAVLARIELGEGDAAIVYATDARSSADVRVIPIPADANVAAVYAAVVPRSSRHAAESRAFVEWLSGAEARAVLERFGFTPPP